MVWMVAFLAVYLTWWVVERRRFYRQLALAKSRARGLPGSAPRLTREEVTAVSDALPLTPAEHAVHVLRDLHTLFARAALSNTTYCTSGTSVSSGNASASGASVTVRVDSPAALPVLPAPAPPAPGSALPCSLLSPANTAALFQPLFHHAQSAFRAAFAPPALALVAPAPALWLRLLFPARLLAPALPQTLRALAPVAPAVAVAAAAADAVAAAETAAVAAARAAAEAEAAETAAADAAAAPQDAAARTAAAASLRAASAARAAAVARAESAAAALVAAAAARLTAARAHTAAGANAAVATESGDCGGAWVRVLDQVLLVVSPDRAIARTAAALLAADRDNATDGNSSNNNNNNKSSDSGSGGEAPPPAPPAMASELATPLRFPGARSANSLAAAAAAAAGARVPASAAAPAPQQQQQLPTAGLDAGAAAPVAAAARRAGGLPAVLNAYCGAVRVPAPPLNTEAGASGAGVPALRAGVQLGPLPAAATLDGVAATLPAAAQLTVTLPSLRAAAASAGAAGSGGAAVTMCAASAAGSDAAVLWRGADERGAPLALAVVVSAMVRLRTTAMT